MEPTREERRKQFQHSLAVILEAWPSVAAWIQEEGYTPADVEEITIQPGLRQKSQEETDYSGYREYAPTGRDRVILTIAGQTSHRTLLRGEK